MTKLTTASILAFERKLDISDATFTQKTVRMTYLKLQLRFEINQ